MKMKTWVKVLIAVVGSGVTGGLSFSSGLLPEWAVVFGALSVAVSGTMAILIGWPPKKENV